MRLNMSINGAADSFQMRKQFDVIVTFIWKTRYEYQFLLATKIKSFVECDASKRIEVGQNLNRKNENKIKK